jgi:hypothetical protein
MRRMVQVLVPLAGGRLLAAVPRSGRVISSQFGIPRTHHFESPAKVRFFACLGFPVASVVIPIIGLSHTHPNHHSVITYRGPIGASRRSSSVSAGSAHRAAADDKPAAPLRQRLAIFYKERAPEKMNNIDKIIDKFAGKEAELWDKLNKMYPTKIAEVRSGEVSPKYLLDPHERAGYEREQAARLLEEQEQIEHATLQQHRWRTDVWSLETEANARKLQNEIEEEDETDALKAEVRVLCWCCVCVCVCAHAIW